MRGVYALIVLVGEPFDSEVGALGHVVLDPGIWVYVGSAMGRGSTSIEQRVRRHLSDEKRLHWHIDYVLTCAKVVQVVWAESTSSKECDLVQALVRRPGFAAGPRGFGASDCKRGCTAHIVRASVDRVHVVVDQVTKAFVALGLRPRLIGELHLARDSQVR